MATLHEGAEISTAEVVAADARPGAPIVIADMVGEFPHGQRYRGKQDATPVLVTVLDPVLYADLGARAALTRNLQAAARNEHRSLLPVYGWERTEEGFLIVEADPGGTTVREFARHRAARGRTLDGETVYTLVAHVCNALSALHPQVHGYVTADTVLVSGTGRVFLSACGVGPTLPQARSFPRFRTMGRLPNVAPEQLLSPPQLSEGTDIFGIATLFIELVTGRPMLDAGQPIEELGLVGPGELLHCLERATAPSPTARPPDVATFKSELADAVRAGPLQRSDPTQATEAAAMDPAPEDADKPTAVPPHPNRGLPYPPMHTGHGTPYPAPTHETPPPQMWGPAGPPVAGYGQHPTPYPHGYALPPPHYPAPPGTPAPSVPFAAPPPAPPPPGLPAIREIRSAPPPPPPPASAPEPAAPLRADPSPELAELDAAARRINTLEPEAALELTESVARVNDPHAEDVEEPPPVRAAASSSLLGLRLDAFDDAAARLSTLDGQPAEEARPTASGRFEPASSDAYFGGVLKEEANKPDTKQTDTALPENAEEDSDARPLYYVVRRSGERVGPHSAFELGQQAQAGKIAPEDILRHRNTGDEVRAGKHPALRKHFNLQLDLGPVGTPSLIVPPPRSPARRAQPVAPPPARSGPSTPLLLLLVVVAFGVAGYFLMGR